MDLRDIVNPEDAGGFRTAPGAHEPMSKDTSPGPRRKAPGRHSQKRASAAAKRPAGSARQERTQRRPRTRGGSPVPTRALAAPASALPTSTAHSHRRHHAAGPPLHPQAVDHLRIPTAVETAAPHLSPSTQPPSPARQLIRRAQQIAEIERDWLGRRPFIMDVILDDDAKPAAPMHSENAGLDALQHRGAQPTDSRRDYVFRDWTSLERYWAEQATMWRATAAEPPHYPSGKRFQLSAERSTASWGMHEDGDEDPRTVVDSDLWSSTSVSRTGPQSISWRNALLDSQQPARRCDP